MTRRRECATTCCSTPTCEIGSHAFGTDGSGVPTGWTLRDGAFDVVGGLLSTNTPNSLALFSTPHPDGIASAIVEVEVYFAGNEQEIIVFDHDGSDDDNFYYVLVELYFLSLYRMNGGTPELLRCVRADNTAGPATITAYFDGETSGMFAATNGTHSVWTDVGTGHTGTYVGLGTRTIDSQADFDNFVATKYKQSGNDCEEFVPDDCDLATDEFDSGDDADPGCPWDEVAGTSALGSGKFLFTANNSRAVFTPSAPTGAMTVAVDAMGSANDNIIEIGLGANSAGSTYYYVRLPVGTSKTLRIGSTAGGDIASATVTTTAGVTIPVIAALANGRLCVTVAGTTISGVATIPGTASHATLGCRTLSSGNVSFDNFEFRKGYSVDDPTCGRCGAVGPNCGTNCCAEAHTQMIVDIGAGLTDKATCAWCSQLDGEFTAIFDEGCLWVYCQHTTAGHSAPCDCADYSCDDDCADGGFPESGGGTTNCRSGDLAASQRCNGISVYVEIRVDDDNRCYLWARVMVLSVGDVTTATPCSIPNATVLAEACYATPLGDDVAPCSGDTYTLELYSGSITCDGSYRNGIFFPPITDGCNGSFPATITVRSAA